MDARQPYRSPSDLAIPRRQSRVAGTALIVLSFAFTLDLNPSGVQAAEPADRFEDKTQNIFIKRENKLLDEPASRFLDESQKFFAHRGIQLMSAQFSDASSTENIVPPEPTSKSQSENEPEPLGQENSRLSSEANSRLPRKLIPAPKMVIRRDPSNQRFLGNDKLNGKSIQTVQKELQMNEVPSESSTRFAEVGFDDDLPYGKYLYIHHGPLFFEDIPAERYGEVWHPCFQPVVSFTKFMGTIPVLPYKITADYYAANHEGVLYAYDHQYNLRPGILEGSYFPSLDVVKQYPRSNFAGAAVTAGTATGLIFLLP